jgi:hypothetical protein
MFVWLIIVSYPFHSPLFSSLFLFKTCSFSDSNRPEIIATDIETCNGMIHLVDAVMLYETAERLGLPPTDAVPTAPTISSAPVPAPTPTTSTCETLGT